MTDIPRYGAPRHGDDFSASGPADASFEGSGSIADLLQGIIGMALFYTAYSTWKGRMLYLEDLVVTEAARRGGYGRQLFEAVLDEARATGAKLLKWQVLDWNEPAIGFYKSFGAVAKDEWTTYRLTGDALAELAG